MFNYQLLPFLFILFVALSGNSQSMCGKLFSEFKSLGNGLYLQTFFSTYTINSKMVKFGMTYKITPADSLSSAKKAFSYLGISFTKDRADTVKIDLVETEKAHRLKGYYRQLFAAFLRDNPQIRKIKTRLALDNGNIAFKHLISQLSNHPKFIQPDMTKSADAQFKECCAQIPPKDYEDQLVASIKQSPSYKLRQENRFENIENARIEFNSVWESYSIYYDASKESGF